MNKKTLSVLMFSIMFLSIGYVNAGTILTQEDSTLNGVNFVEPNDYWYLGDVYIEWENGESIENMFLKYSLDCDDDSWESLIGNIPASQFSTIWETLYEGISDGEYCLRMGSSDEYAYSRNFCIDNTEPNVAVCADCCWTQGVESDYEWAEETGTVIEIDYQDEIDCNQCDLDCMINWGDDTADQPCDDVCGLEGFEDDECIHQYADSGEYEITVSVEDCSGNIGENTDLVVVENIEPECEIDGPLSATVYQVVDFSGIITNSGDFLGEVDADMDKMVYSWDFNDGNIDSGEFASNIFSTGGVYTVELTVDDTDGGVSTCSHEIEIIDPTPLANQEVAAYYDLDADFVDDAGDVPHSFDTGLDEEGDITCEATVAPSNVDVFADGNDCVVEWNDLRPTNNEQGVHSLIIKALNTEGDYEYYSFDITVYSWIIHLQEGWNLFSIPYVPEDESVDSVVLDQLYDSLPGGTEYSLYSYQFNGEESTWLKSRRSGYGDLDQVSPGYAYWIKIDEGAGDDVYLRGFGTQLRSASPGLPPEIDVPTNDWTMIGRYGIISQYNCPNPHAGAIHKQIALKSVSRGPGAMGNVLNVFTLNDEGGYMDMDSTNSLENNKGYLLWVENGFNNNVPVESYAPLDRFYTEDVCEQPY